jgi:hypothetical protein
MCRYNARTRSRCRMRRMVEEQWRNYYMTDNSMTLAGLKWLRGQDETPAVTVDPRDAGCRRNSHHDTNLMNQWNEIPIARTRRKHHEFTQHDDKVWM